MVLGSPPRWANRNPKNNETRHEHTHVRQPGSTGIVSAAALQRSIDVEPLTCTGWLPTER